MVTHADVDRAHGFELQALFGQMRSRAFIIVGILLVGIAAFALGVATGIVFEAANLTTDFCSDNSSPRYIRDDAARMQSCGR